MKRRMSEVRHNSVTKALRKRKIVKEVYHDEWWSNQPLHTFAKGKVHCSCPLCSFTGKTRQDVRRLTAMKQDLLENGCREGLSLKASW